MAYSKRTQLCAPIVSHRRRWSEARGWREACLIDLRRRDTVSRHSPRYRLTAVFHTVDVDVVRTQWRCQLTTLLTYLFTYSATHCRRAPYVLRQFHPSVRSSVRPSVCLSHALCQNSWTDETGFGMEDRRVLLCVKRWFESPRSECNFSLAVWPRTESFANFSAFRCKPHDPTVISFESISACNRQTDGRTDTHYMSTSRS